MTGICGREKFIKHRRQPSAEIRVAPVDDKELIKETFLSLPSSRDKIRVDTLKKIGKEHSLKLLKLKYLVANDFRNFSSLSR